MEKNKKIEHFVVEMTWLEGMEHGWGCGYVALPEGHPCYGMEYGEIESKYEIEAHGCLTWSDFAKEMKHAPDKFKDGNFWIVGFDTAHAYDTQEKWPKEKVDQHARELAYQFENLKAIV